MHLLGRLAVGGALALLARGAPCGEAAGRLQADLEQGLGHGLPSLSAAVATRQGVIWSTAVGAADLTTGARAHPAYLYGIGSITKTFVACVVEQLADEGRLDLDAPLVSVLGAASLDHIPNAQDATIRQLLDHTSGIPSWEFDPVWIRRGRGSELEPGRIWGKGETLDYLRQGRDPAAHAAGKGYTYSNSNYTLLGLVIEKVTGAEAVAEIHRRILEPMRLGDIRFEGFEAVDVRRVPARYHFVSPDFIRIAGLSPAFRRVTPRLADVSASNLSTEWTAGAVLATAHDLALFARDLRDGAIVGAAALKRMQSFKPTDDPEEDMGQGLALDRYGDETLIGYTGNVLGFGAAMGWAPDEDVVIVVMTNAGSMHSGESAYWPERFLKDTAFIRDARALARELAPRPATSRP